MFFFCSFWVVAMLFKAGSYFQLAFSLYGLTFFLYSRIILGIVLNGLFDVCFVFADHSVVIGADGLLGRGLCQFFSRTDEQRLLLLYWKRKKRGQSIKMNAKQNQAWFKAFLEKSLSCYVFLCVSFNHWNNLLQMKEDEMWPVAVWPKHYVSRFIE